jgi:hypothetical protein
VVIIGERGGERGRLMAPDEGHGERVAIVTVARRRSRRGAGSFPINSCTDRSVRVTIRLTRGDLPRSAAASGLNPTEARDLAT